MSDEHTLTYSDDQLVILIEAHEKERINALAERAGMTRIAFIKHMVENYEGRYPIVPQEGVWGHSDAPGRMVTHFELDGKLVGGGDDAPGRMVQTLKLTEDDNIPCDDEHHNTMNTFDFDSSKVTEEKITVTDASIRDARRASVADEAAYDYARRPPIEEGNNNPWYSFRKPKGLTRITLPEQMRDDLKRIAQAEHREVEDVIHTALGNYINQQDHIRPRESII